MRRLSAVAAADALTGEEGTPVAGDAFDQYLWWIMLPGMNWRSRGTWPPAHLANAICAEACSVRLIEIAGQVSRLQKFFQDSRRLREWLNEAEEDDLAAYHRRMTLCLVMSVATPRTEPQHLVEYAKALLGS
jgi:hypothetical protein